MTTPPPGPGRVDSGHPGPSGPAGSEDRTRPVHAGAQQQSPVPTQYLPPEQQQQSWPQPGGYPPPAQYGQQQQPGGWPQQGGYGGQFPPFQPPPPSGGGNRTGLIAGIVVLVLVLVGGGAGWYFILGPGANKTPAATPPAASGPAAPSGSSSGGTSPSGGAAPDADKGGDVGVDVEVGDCVNLSGSDSNADAEPATCGSQDANYKVIGKAPTQSQCVSDADATYFESLGGSEVGALCLDVDWVKGDCYDVSGLDPARVSCTGAGGPKRVKVGETIQGTSSVSRCPDNGYQYDERKFVVCLSAV